MKSFVQLTSQRETISRNVQNTIIARLDCYRALWLLTNNLPSVYYGTDPSLAL